MWLFTNETQAAYVSLTHVMFLVMGSCVIHAPSDEILDEFSRRRHDVKLSVKGKSCNIRKDFCNSWFEFVFFVSSRAETERGLSRKHIIEGRYMMVMFYSTRRA